MKRTILLMAAALVSCTLFLTSCDDDDKNDNAPATGSEIEINVASSWGTWNYFSFSDGKIVGTGDASAESDAEWKARVDWDIAFTRLYARTNSGTSGNGSGGVVEIEAGNADKAAVFANLVTAPTSGYLVDEKAELMIGMGSPTGPTYYDGSTSATINDWLAMDGMSINVTPKVFAVKTATGDYAKIYLKGYDGADGSRAVVMEYVYQADGSTNLSTSEK